MKNSHRLRDTECCRGLLLMQSRLRCCRSDTSIMV